MNIKSAKDLVSTASADVDALSADEAVKFTNDPNVVFVDVRESDERRKTGALKGAVHAPLGLSGIPRRDVASSLAYLDCTMEMLNQLHALAHHHLGLVPSKDKMN